MISSGDDPVLRRPGTKYAGAVHDFSKTSLEEMVVYSMSENVRLGFGFATKTCNPMTLMRAESEVVAMWKVWNQPEEGEDLDAVIEKSLGTSIGIKPVYGVLDDFMIETIQAEVSRQRSEHWAKVLRG